MRGIVYIDGQAVEWRQTARRTGPRAQASGGGIVVAVGRGAGPYGLMIVRCVRLEQRWRSR